MSKHHKRSALETTMGDWKRWVAENALSQAPAASVNAPLASKEEEHESVDARLKRAFARTDYNDMRMAGYEGTFDEYLAEYPGWQGPDDSEDTEDLPPADWNKLTPEQQRTEDFMERHVEDMGAREEDE
jgi:hypothetical protein